MTLIQDHSNIAFNVFLLMALRNCFSFSAVKCIDDTVQHSVIPSSVRQTRQQPSSRVVISRLFPLLIIFALLFKLAQSLLIEVANPREFSLLLLSSSFDHLVIALSALFFHCGSILTRRNSSSPISNHSTSSPVLQPASRKSSSGKSSLPSLLTAMAQTFGDGLSKSNSSLSSASRTSILFNEW